MLPKPWTAFACDAEERRGVASHNDPGLDGLLSNFAHTWVTHFGDGVVQLANAGWVNAVSKRCRGTDETNISQFGI
jgi:hypothetical protein